jgi:hypothetical protein
MTLDPQKRPYTDDPVGLVKTKRRLAALRLAAQHELFFVPVIPTGLGSYMYEPKLGDIELVDPDLTWTLHELSSSQYLSSTDNRTREVWEHPTSLLLNDKGWAALARWEKTEKRRRGGT